MKCINCKHFHRDFTWGPALTVSEYDRCIAGGAIVGFIAGNYRRLEEVSADGTCLAMTDAYDTPNAAVKYYATEGNQHNDGVGAPRVGEDFGCIKFEQIGE